MYRLRFMIILMLFATTGWQSDAAELERRLRRPVALTASDNYKWSYVANRNSGSITVINTAALSAANEIDVGGRLTDLAILDDTHLLILDEKNHQLVVLAGQGTHWKVVSRLDIAQYPIQLQVDRTTKRCFIASLWSRTVTVVDLSRIDHKPLSQKNITAKLQIPFEPHKMCLVKERKKLIVAGSFQNKLAIVDTDNLKLTVTKKIPGHNIRGLAISNDGKRVLIAQQELNSLARSTRDDVHWGNMLSNLLVSLSLDDLCHSEADVLKRREVIHLGEPGRAAGDPGPIYVLPKGKLIVVLSGVDEIAISNDKHHFDFERVAVGRHPVAAISTPDGRLFVANQFSDSISIVDMNGTKQIERVSLGPQRELSPDERGEMLFFDSHLSHDGWMSCHSCHTNGHSSGQLNDNLSDGSFGAPKRVLSLVGVGQTGPWAWDGKVQTLSQQVKNSIQKTMQGSAPSEKQVADLVAYLNTLTHPPVLTELRTAAPNETIINHGRQLFQALDCKRCHVPPLYTSTASYDVGLKDSAGNTRFNPPSLRNVGRQTSFFHDGRALTLKDVFTKYKHQTNRTLTEVELNALLQYLTSL
ncbi:cytochrome c peroxidase [Gimesia aquarii]|uniref:Cytochrome c551 peroxidase n=1 Tax=Gimesia aquarii TaxID=2527964 RepID=A0A517WYU7_9PLAN|nr:cytochrome c peroxidase [Gimesia aquarii]QDU10427.1 Cytochrome c551 peroxidase precursor [Gimesia aquarii]